MRPLLRILTSDGDASEIALLLAGLIALIGLVSRMTGVW